MNAETIANLKASHQAEINRFAFVIRLLDQFGERLSDTASFAPSYYMQVSVDNRDDLALFMSLAPRWAKSPGNGCIGYMAEVNGERFQILAKSAALPPTCKMVEEDYLIEAVPAQPASVGKRMVLKCEQPVSEPVPVEAATIPSDSSFLSLEVHQ